MDNTASVVDMNHQGGLRSCHMSQLAHHLPSPPLELEASEVATRRSCPRRAQSCSQRAFTSAPPSGRMTTPPRDSPADLETLRGRSGRPVCLPGHVPLPAVLLPVRRDPRHSWPSAGLWVYVSMCFPQWAFSHRHCVRSGPLCGPWMGHGDSMWATSSGSRHHHFS